MSHPYIYDPNLHNKWWGGACEWCSGTYIYSFSGGSTQEVHGFNPKNKFINRIRCYERSHTDLWFVVKHVMILFAVIILFVGMSLSDEKSYYVCEEIDNRTLCDYVNEQEYNNSFIDKTNEIVNGENAKENRQRLLDLHDRKYLEDR